jgi:RNA polymerase sigma-70 factor (ECF subfamily)
LKEYASYDDKALFLLIADGDETAFGELFNRYISILQPFAMSFTKSATAAEEMVQDTFIKVWLNRDKLPDIDNPKGWIMTITSRECISFLRKLKSEARLMERVSKLETGDGNTTHDQIGVKELKEMIHEAVEQFPPQRKKIYKMSREEGLKHGEIADALGISVNTVKNVLVTNLKAIRAFLESKGQHLGALLILFIKNY